jgi:hypothetical protein
VAGRDRAASVDDASGRGEDRMVTVARYALAVLHHGLGDYDDALAAAAEACEYDELVHSSLALPELVEAAVRAGQPERAAAALEILGPRARASGTPWALGQEARSRALLRTGPAAEELYREAIQRLGDCRMGTHLARTHLVYGEWQRCEGRRQAAREQLRTAHEMLSGMGADAFRGARRSRAARHRRTAAQANRPAG